MSSGDGLASLRGLCPVPFLAESNFPSTGGYVRGRVCASVQGIANGDSCCLPCNSVYWLYPDSFYDLTRIPGYIAIASLAICLYLLLSFIVLPKTYTNRHYLNTGLTISTIILELGFVVPVLTRPEQCYNEITPNGIQSSMTCAWSGAFVIFGGVAINSWILVRAVNMHLLICWNITLGNKFFYIAQVFAWGLSAVLLGTCLAITGVSFRFGDYCHVNHHLAMGTYWGPLLVFAGLSIFIQLSTFGYCLHVYLASTWADNGQRSTDDSRSSGAGSARPKSARAVYRRVRQVIGIQWRGLCIALIGVVDVVYFALVFIFLDQKTTEAMNSLPDVLPWVGCLMASNGNKNDCLAEAAAISVSEATLIATLILLAIVGFEVALLIGSPGMITGWKELFTRRQAESKFLPLHDEAASGRAYEMLKISTNIGDTPSTVISPFSEAHSTTMRSPLDRAGFALSSPHSTTQLLSGNTREKPEGGGDYFSVGEEMYGAARTAHRDAAKANMERAYRSPRMSFSRPRSPVGLTFASSSPPNTSALATRQPSESDIENTLPGSAASSARVSLRATAGGGGGANAHFNSNGLGLHPVIRESSVYEYQSWAETQARAYGHR